MSLYSLPKEILIEKIIPQVQREKEEEIKDLKNKMQKIYEQFPLVSLCSVKECNSKAFSKIYLNDGSTFYEGCHILRKCGRCNIRICSNHEDIMIKRCQYCQLDFCVKDSYNENTCIECIIPEGNF